MGEVVVDALRHLEVLHDCLLLLFGQQTLHSAAEFLMVEVGSYLRYIHRPKLRKFLFETVQISFTACFLTYLHAFNGGDMLELCPH